MVERVGFLTAASVLNLVAITAMLSSRNSGIFGSSSMLHSLSLQEDAPKLLQPVSARRVPNRCITACVAMLLVGVGLNYVAPERVFLYLMSLISALLLWTWEVTVVCHLLYRRRLARNEAREVSFRLPASP